MAEQLAKEYGVKVKAYQCDVGKPDLVTQTFQQIDEEMGPIAGCVCCSYSMSGAYKADEISAHRSVSSPTLVSPSSRMPPR